MLECCLEKEDLRTSTGPENGAGKYYSLTYALKMSGEYDSGREVAVKIIRKAVIAEKGVTARVVNEVKIHWQLHHSHIVDLLVCVMWI